VTSNELEESPTVVLATAVDGDTLFQQPLLYVKPNKYVIVTGQIPRAPETNVFNCASGLTLVITGVSWVRPSFV
jgi:hypothetical protein